MHELRLDFDDSHVVGSGVDIIAPFELKGRLRTDGTVEMVKHYLDRHTVLYVGEYDGEGTFHGTWDIDGHQGQWSIKVLGLEAAADEPVQEIGGA